MRRGDERALRLAREFSDARSKRVVFLSHCILNQNVRYLGGAFRAGSVAEIARQCLDQGIGIVQMPCPEEAVWGGVLKRWLLLAYGGHGLLRGVGRRLLVPWLLWYTRARYRGLARRVARQIADYARSGILVVGVVGIDGSPSCGVTRRLNSVQGLEALARWGSTGSSPEALSRQLAACQESGEGMFAAELRVQLSVRGLAVPWMAHDMFAEMQGAPSTVRLSAPDPARAES